MGFIVVLKTNLIRHALTSGELRDCILETYHASA
jgi:hypothetical protein